MRAVQFSRVLALVSGIALPALEIVRRRSDWPGPIETWPFWLDDFLIGALLIVGAIKCNGRFEKYDGTNLASLSSNTGWLIAAWGFALGMGVGSTLAQYSHIVLPNLPDDPSGLAHGWMVLIKAGLCAIALLGLVTSMRRA